MKKEAVLGKLTEATLALTSSSQWQRWLKTRRSFHRYSFRNQILIAVQDPEATMLKGYRAWQNDCNRQVRKGEKGIYILAPAKYKVTEQDGSVDWEVRGFRGVAVFDVRQTEQMEDRPEVELNPPGVYEFPPSPDDPDLFADLARSIEESRNVEVDSIAEDSDPHLGRAFAYWDSSRSRIVLRDSLAGAGAVRALVHEAAHAWDDRLEGQLTNPAIKELVADSVACVVCDGLGLDTMAVNASYLAHYAGPLDDPVKALSAIGARVLAIAEAIEKPLADVRSRQPA